MNKYIIVLVCFLGIGVVLGTFQLIGGLIMEIYYSGEGMYLKNIILGTITVAVCLVCIGYSLGYWMEKR